MIVGNLAAVEVELPTYLGDTLHSRTVAIAGVAAGQPLSRPAFDVYISLRPIGSPLRALSTKYGSPATEVRRSNRAGMGGDHVVTSERSKGS